MGIFLNKCHKMKILIFIGLIAISSALKLRLTDEQCDGTVRPAGCCPEQNWFCCADNMYCAATEADCPMVASKANLMRMAAKKQCDGTVCPAGCCPEQNWFCCPDDQYCAATAADCPFIKEFLIRKH